jgi:hypothetical protein
MLISDYILDANGPDSRWTITTERVYILNAYFLVKIPFSRAEEYTPISKKVVKAIGHRSYQD